MPERVVGADAGSWPAYSEVGTPFNVLSRATDSLCLATTSQTVYYFRHYPRDRPWLRFLVATIWCIDAFQLAFQIDICAG